MSQHVSTCLNSLSVGSTETPTDFCCKSWIITDLCLGWFSVHGTMAPKRLKKPDGSSKVDAFAANSEHISIIINYQILSVLKIFKAQNFNMDFSFKTLWMVQKSCTSWWMSKIPWKSKKKQFLQCFIVPNSYYPSNVSLKNRWNPLKRSRPPNLAIVWLQCLTYPPVIWQCKMDGNCLRRNGGFNRKIPFKWRVEWKNHL